VITPSVDWLPTRMEACGPPNQGHRLPLGRPDNQTCFHQANDFSSKECALTIPAKSNVLVDMHAVSNGPFDRDAVHGFVK
jgi:hypothetical protein